MANETTLTIVGNLVRDPDLRFTPNGHAVATITIATTARTYTTRDGHQKTETELQLTDIGPSLTRATTQTTPNTQPQTQTQPQHDPWTTTTDTPPF